MTLEKENVGKPAQTESDIVRLFEQRGIRWTPQRQMVLDTFQRRSGHISAEQVHSEISKLFPRVNLSTVYRTLELLCELGIAVEVEPNKDGDRRRYELVEGAEHYHLICENCEAEMELAPEVIKQLQAQIQERYNFQLKLPHFIGLGRCARCQEHKTTGQISPE
ncbi:MAG: ferric uptake regulation protein [Chloroflexi bacterium]|nr:ferric uptake regulation protein [Chloroflexota bacterium]